MGTSANEKIILLFKSLWRLKSPRIQLEMSNAEIMAYSRRGKTITRAVEMAREDQMMAGTPGIDY